VNRLGLEAEHSSFYYGSYVENGQNPDLFTQAFVSRAATENQFTNGKIKAVDVS
jgi:hypothetical protein